MTRGKRIQYIVSKEGVKHPSTYEINIRVIFYTLEAIIIEVRLR